MKRDFNAWAVRHTTPALLSLVNQGLVSGFGFLTGIATARLVGIAPFGRFVIVMIFVGLAQNVHNALVTAPMMTLMGGRLRASKAYDLSFMVLATLLSIVAGVAVALMLDGFFALRGEILSIGFLMAAALVGAAQNLQFTLRRLLFAQGKGPRAIVMDASRALLFPVALVVLHVLAGPLTVVRLMWVLGATALVTSLPVALPLLRQRWRHLRLSAVVRRHVPLARWLLPVVVVTFGQEQLVWILAGSMLGDASMGGLRSAQYVVGLVLLMLTATENVIPVGAARTFAQAGRSGLNRYLVATGAKLGVLVVVCLLIIGIPAEFWLKLVFGAPFEPFANCLRVLAVAALFIHVRDMATHMFRATKNTGVIFRAFVVSGLVSLVCLYPLLHEAGLLGAALVVLIGHATSMIYLLGAAFWQGGGDARDRLHDLLGRVFSMKATAFKAPPGMARPDGGAGMRAKSLMTQSLVTQSLLTGRLVGLRLVGLAVAATLLTSAGAASRATPNAPLVIRVEAGGQEGAPQPGQPVATLAQALAIVADLHARSIDAPIRIDIGPGTFRIEDSVRIGPEHGGTETAPLVIRGAPGGQSRLLGSVALEPVRDAPDAAVLARLPAEARRHVRLYRLPEAALADRRIHGLRTLQRSPVPVAFEVFDDGGALVPAQWPNAGWAATSAGMVASTNAAFSIDDARLSRWQGEPDLWAEGYWRWNWLFEALPVVGLDPASRRVSLVEAPYEGILPKARFRIVHALSELDAPGEWWRDEARGLLVAWPRAGHEALEASVVDTLISIEGASHVRLEDLRLERSRGDLLTVRGGRDVVVRGSLIAWAAGTGAVFEGTQAGGLDHCAVEQSGLAGVRLEGGDRAGLRSAGLFVRDSRIGHYARLAETQHPGIEVGGVGAVVSGNLIHDAGGPAITMRGNDHRISGNEIAHVLAGASDAGAIYSGRDWTARGTIIERNFIHDVRADPGFEVKGVYLDDEASGFTVRDNLFLRVDQAVFIGGGRDNRVQGNVFVASNPAIHVDSRGQTWAAKAIADPGSDIRKAYAAMPVASALWRSRYPELAGLLADAPEVAKRNRLDDNVFVASEPFRFDDGGQSAAQIIAGNVGPDGITPGQGGDMARLAATSDRPEDFGALLGPGATPLPRLTFSATRRSAGPPFAF